MKKKKSFKVDNQSFEVSNQRWQTMILFRIRFVLFNIPCDNATITNMIVTIMIITIMIMIIAGGPKNHRGERPVTAGGNSPRGRCYPKVNIMIMIIIMKMMIPIIMVMMMVVIIMTVIRIITFIIVLPRNAGDEIKLLVCDGFNPASVPNNGRLVLQSSAFTETCHS